MGVFFCFLGQLVWEGTWWQFGVGCCDFLFFSQNVGIRKKATDPIFRRGLFLFQQFLKGER